MSELERLMEERKAIDQKIKELRDEGGTFGLASVGRVTYPTSKPDRWFVAVDVKTVDYTPYGYRPATVRKRAIINGLTKEEVIGRVPEIIRDLQGLYDQEQKA